MHTLNPHDLALLRSMQKVERDKQRYIKITALLMLHVGCSPTQVAESLDIHESTVHRYVRRFTERGDVEQYLQADYRGSSRTLTSEQIMQLCDELNDRLYRNSSEVRDYIFRTFGVTYSRGHVRRLLNDLGYSFKRTTPVPAKADPREQQRFLREELEPLLKRTRRQGLPLYFCDAAHPQYNTRSALGWIARGHRFCVPTTSGRHRVNINAAINVHDPSDLEYVDSKQVNADSTIALFKKLEARHPECPIYVVCDNARFYKCKDLDKWLSTHNRIKLIYLPPYSPNLNLIERLWKYLRKTVIDTTYYPTLDAFKGAIMSFFRRIEDHLDNLKTLLQPNFHIELGLAN